MANIQLFDKAGNEINPKTLAALVILSGGGSVEEKLIALEAALSGQSGTHVVSDIAARDDIAAPKVGDQAWVIDATADSTVSKGGAKYIYQSEEAGWVKTAEAESMDVVLKWANVQDKPTATVLEIDDAVTKKHDHANKADVLDKLGVSGGKLQLDGADVNSDTVGAVLLEADAEIPANLTENGIVFRKIAAA
ncbi:MAG: hypothetical protein K2O70_07860 [Desulfovibrionaceae bacterium]|nr:hypothetical protein [Desulfovibrionaceae bacterium]